MTFFSPYGKILLLNRGADEQKYRARGQKADFGARERVSPPKRRSFARTVRWAQRSIPLRLSPTWRTIFAGCSDRVGFGVSRARRQSFFIITAVSDSAPFCFTEKFLRSIEKYETVQRRDHRRDRNGRSEIQSFACAITLHSMSPFGGFPLFRGEKI